MQNSPSPTRPAQKRYLAWWDRENGKGRVKREYQRESSIGRYFMPYVRGVVWDEQDDAEFFGGEIQVLDRQTWKFQHLSIFPG